MQGVGPQQRSRTRGSGYLLAEMTWPEVEAAREAAPLVIVPLGSCEQHGRGMALQTDTVRAVELAKLVAERMAPRAVIAPETTVGLSEHHMGFPGTITLTPQTLQQVVYEMVHSLYRHGWRKVFLLNGHGGNNAVVDVVSIRIRTDFPDMHLASSGISALVPDVISQEGVSELRGHSCEVETSQALYLAPELVRKESLVRGTDRRADLDAAGRLSRMHPAIHFPQPYHRLDPNGALGDATAASAEFGERQVSAALDRLTSFLEQFIALPLPDAGSAAGPRSL
ncbi:creatininase family protein [Planotetraspora phitsanulokensis]|uniref:Amidase n=2 Tax=Planotetraspora phitsanulokensis TaxID=575192 RepID=A0A8J3XLY4_9ACTN|nr:amidase [Planotetraspora phitsanulokensis]